MKNKYISNPKIFFLALFIGIGVVIAIPVSTTWVFSDVFSLNYTKTSFVELVVGGTNSVENFGEGLLEIITTPDVVVPPEIPIEVPEEIITEVPEEEIITEVPEEIITEVPEEKIIRNSTTINLINSGLVLWDPLNDTAINDYWTFGGNAEFVNAPHDHFADADGMHIGIQSPESGVYAGYNAKIPPSEGSLFHSTITIPTNYISNGFLQNGLYVQSSVGPPNFVTCVVITSSTGKLSWAVTHTYFDSNGISNYNVLWSDNNPKPGLTRECTIVTNGDNFLKVILDRTVVYANYKLDLQMIGPFLAYVETQSSYAEEKLYGIYEDFYITTGDTVQILNLPGYIEKVTLTDMSNNILATGDVIDGTGTIDVSNFHFPFTANIHAVQSLRQVMSTPSPVTIFGGDVYSGPERPTLLDVLVNDKDATTFSGPQIVKVIVNNPALKDTRVPETEPVVTVNGVQLRMVQETDMNWYGYFAEIDSALIADSQVVTPGLGLDFGVFCSKDSGFVLGLTLNDTQTEGFAIQDPDLVSNEVNGNPDATPLTNLCVDPIPNTTPKDLMNVLDAGTIKPGTPYVLQGQIGVRDGFWPFIQLYPFNENDDVIIQYSVKDKPPEIITLTFNNG